MFIRKKKPNIFLKICLRLNPWSLIFQVNMVLWDHKTGPEESIVKKKTKKQWIFICRNIPVVSLVPSQSCTMNPGLLTSTYSNYLSTFSITHRVGLGILECNTGYNQVLNSFLSELQNKQKINITSDNLSNSLFFLLIRKLKQLNCLSLCMA